MGAAARATVSIAAFTVLRGVANFALQVVVAGRFGASHNADAYFVVIGFGLVISELLVGVLTVAALPTLIHIRESEGEDSGWRLEGSVLAWCVAALLVAALALFAAAAPAVRLLAPGFAPGISRLSVDLLRFSLPGLFAYGCALLFGLALQARNAFVSTAAVPTLPFLGGTVGLIVAPEGKGLFHLMTGFTVGAAVGLVIQVRQWRKVTGHRRVAVTLRHHALLGVAKLVSPVLVATSCVFLLQVVLRMSASDLGEGSVAAIGFANQIAAVPVALLTTPVGTVLLSRFSFLMRDGRLESGARLLNEAVLVVALGSALIGALLIGLAQPITQLLFQRGSFTASDSALTADVLRWLAAGLFSVSATSLLSRAFAAARIVQPVAIVWVATVAFFFTTWYPLRASLDVGGLAAVYSAAYVFALVLLLVLLRREGAGIGMREIVSLGARLTVSAALAAAASWGVHELSAPTAGSVLEGTAGDAARLGASILVGGAAFVGATYAMRGAEAAAAHKWMRMMVRRREGATTPSNTSS